MSAMRGRRNLFGPLALLVLLTFAASPGRADDFADEAGIKLRDEALADLRAGLEQRPNEATLRALVQTVALQLGGSFSERQALAGRAFRITLALYPLPARQLIAAMGWQRPYAISSDAPRSGWTLRLWSADVDDRNGPRIAIHTPQVGAWTVDAALAGRPEGELPRLGSGGSPAYDLLHGYDAKVASIVIQLASAAGQTPEGMEEAPEVSAPKSAPDEAFLEDWFAKHKDFGSPRYFDSKTAATDMRVLAAWNIPYSGLNWTDFWVYCKAPDGWVLLESGQFHPPTDQAHSAVLEEESSEVRFLGREGDVYHRVPVDACRSK